MERTKRELSNAQRRLIHDDMLKLSTEGILKRGAYKDIAAKYCVSIQTVAKIWKRGKENNPSNVNLLKRGRVGPKKKDYALNGRIRNVPLNRRKTVRALAGALNIPKSSLHRRIKNGDVKVCTSPLKPF